MDVCTLYLGLLVCLFIVELHLNVLFILKFNILNLSKGYLQHVVDQLCSVKISGVEGNSRRPSRSRSAIVVNKILV